MEDKRRRAVNALLALNPLVGRRFFPKVTPEKKDRLVNRAQFYILMELQHNGDMRMSALASKSGVSAQQLTSLADGLVENGFIERFPDEKCRRNVIARITEKGSGYIREEHERVLETALAQLGEISEEELDELCTSAEKIREILERQIELKGL